MRTSSIIWTIVVIIIIIGLGWYFFAGMPAQAPVTPVGQTQTTGNATGTDYNAPGSTSASAGQSVVAIGSSASLGSFLTGSNGMTLYTYSPDSPGVSNCTGQCAANWPPYTVAAGTQLGTMSGLTGTLGTITRADGSTQVTYNDQPLYFYIKDKKPGDTVGQGVGGVWYVVKP